MPIQLLTEQQNCGIDLDDINGTYFTPDSLTFWINEACLDIARRAECLMDSETVSTMPMVSTYPAPQNTIRIHEVTFSPNDPQQIYPLMYKGRQEMNAIWAVNQTTPSNYPSFYTTWSQPPFINLQVFPLPSQSGILQYWFYRLPVPVINPTDYLDIPEGYGECVTAYVRYRARRKAGDPIWADDKKLYEEMLGDLITNSRNWTDQTGSISATGTYVPGWLYGGWGS